MTRLEPAVNLKEMAQTLDAEPLETEGELSAFYQPGLQAARGVDRMGRIRLGLGDALDSGQNFKGFVTGHPGVGKTTELRNLLVRGEMAARTQVLWLSVAEELNPGALRFYDILLLILVKLVRSATDPVVVGFDDSHELAPMLARVREHMARRWTKYLKVENADWGGGFSLPFLKLFGNIKSGTAREQGQEEHEVAFVSELLTLINETVQECNRMLEKHHPGKRWVIVLDDFEKIGFAAPAMRDFFIGLRPHLQDLASHLLVMIPVWLYHSEEARLVLPPNFEYFPLPDIPVFQKDHTPDEKSLAALESVVLSRTRGNLFEEGVLRQFCIASGGNLRDLFTLIRNAAYDARLMGKAVIGAGEAKQAIGTLREEYKQRLGQDLDKKLSRLREIYQSEPKSDVQDETLYALLKQRCVLQYNGEAWKGVHPLVVDLLAEFQTLTEAAPAGGTHA